MSDRSRTSATAAHAGDVLVYADYVCPFCYLGYASLDRYREDHAGGDGSRTIAAEWHPFDLRGEKRRPDGTLDESVETGKDEAYFEQAIENVERLAGEYDVEMAQFIDRDIDSYDAQRVAWQARTAHPDRFGRFHRSVFDALWVEGRDIGDRVVLDELAVEAGLPEGFVAATLDDPASLDSLELAFQDARQRGITGVPTFVAGEHAARGAVPPAHLRRLIDGPD